MPTASTAQIHRSTTLVVSARSHSLENGSSRRMPYTLVQSSARCEPTAISAAKNAHAHRTGLRLASLTTATAASAMTGIKSSECVR